MFYTSQQITSIHLERNMCDNTFIPHLHSTKYIDSFPHVYSTQYIDSFGENGDFFEKLQNIHFSHLFGGL